MTAAESAVRGARSSSALDGGGIALDAVADDPLLAGALVDRAGDRGWGDGTGGCMAAGTAAEYLA